MGSRPNDSHNWVATMMGMDQKCVERLAYEVRAHGVREGMIWTRTDEFDKYRANMRSVPSVSCPHSVLGTEVPVPSGLDIRQDGSISMLAGLCARLDDGSETKKDGLAQIMRLRAHHGVTREVSYSSSSPSPIFLLLVI